MGEFFLFMLILFTFGWGSVFLAARLKGSPNRLESTSDSELLARLLEDMDQLSTRLGRVEEDLDFFRELRAPGDPPRLVSPEVPQVSSSPGEDGSGGAS